MRARLRLLGAVVAVLCGSVFGQTDKPNSNGALTIYNQGFAVVRQTLPLSLTSGVNSYSFSGATAHVEAQSVILRDPFGQRRLLIHEQNYRNDPISRGLLLYQNEGKTIDFELVRDGKLVRIPGRIIRSGYVPHQAAWQVYGSEYYAAQMQLVQSGGGEAIVEFEGRIHFGLPGNPLFPELAADAILRPTLNWLLETDKPGKFDAELSYVTRGMRWQADYNIVAPEAGSTVDIIGWVTFDNQSGTTFHNAKIKLLAGDVNKLSPQGMVVAAEYAAKMSRDEMRPQVSEKSFDEYHLYTLERPTTLRDRETKQVEFVRATNVSAPQLYIYDGAWIDANRYRGWSWENIRGDREYGTVCNPKVWVMREFRNAETNGLGMPLPKGRLRFYRRDDDGRLEFTGENIIDHTPANEDVRVYTGNAFDLVGERKRTDYRVDSNGHTLDESFEIKLRNHKKQRVEIRVVEHLYRGLNWTIVGASHKGRKTDSNTMEYRISVPANGEQVLTYTAHYTW